MVRIAISEPARLNELGREWEALEARADCSFFQSWSWVGCLAAERFDRPVLVRGERDGATVALGLFNRRRTREGAASLLLANTGVPEEDAVFIEHNGLLLARGAEDVAAACLRAVAARDTRWGRLAGTRLVLDGVGADSIAAARGAGLAVHIKAEEPAPWIDLARIRHGGKTYLEGLSANARRQLRRSLARYAEAGPVVIERAADRAQAEAYLAEMIVLHQARWTARGRPGAFANPRFVRFHRALIAEALPRGRVDLLRVRAGDHVIGYLYNFRYGGRVLAYQSGFDFSDADAQRKPGLVCHLLAIEAALAAGCRVYDFLAGAHRYKLTLANEMTSLFWAHAVPRRSLRNAAMAMRRIARAGVKAAVPRMLTPPAPASGGSPGSAPAADAGPDAGSRVARRSSRPN